jgi:hypothetical protein
MIVSRCGQLSEQSQESWMTDQTAKQEAIESLPDDVACDEIPYRLYVLHKIRQGMQDVEAGHTVSSEELEIEQW